MARRKRSSVSMSSILWVLLLVVLFLFAATDLIRGCLFAPEWSTTARLSL